MELACRRRGEGKAGSIPGAVGVARAGSVGKAMRNSGMPIHTSAGREWMHAAAGRGAAVAEGASR